MPKIKPKKIIPNQCRFCKNLIPCKHCQDCGVDTSIEEYKHDEGCRYRPVCIACNDTGYNSRGKLCRACLIRAEKIEQYKNRKPTLFE